MCCRGCSRPILSLAGSNEDGNRGWSRRQLRRHGWADPGAQRVVKRTQDALALNEVFASVPQQIDLEKGGEFDTSGLPSHVVLQKDVHSLNLRTRLHIQAFCTRKGPSSRARASACRFSNILCQHDVDIVLHCPFRGHCWCSTVPPYAAHLVWMVA